MSIRGAVTATLPHLDRRSLLSSEACCAKEDGEGGWQHLECSAQDSHFMEKFELFPLNSKLSKPSFKHSNIQTFQHSYTSPRSSFTFH